MRFTKRIRFNNIAILKCLILNANLQNVVELISNTLNELEYAENMNKQFDANHIRKVWYNKWTRSTHCAFYQKDNNVEIDLFVDRYKAIPFISSSKENDKVVQEIHKKLESQYKLENVEII